LGNHAFEEEDDVRPGKAFFSSSSDDVLRASYLELAEAGSDFDCSGSFAIAKGCSAG
jgi:hypothetical protein